MGGACRDLIVRPSCPFSVSLSCSPFQGKIKEMRTVIFLSPPSLPWSPYSDGFKGVSKHPCLKILRPRGRAWMRVTFRVHLHFRAKRLSQRQNPGQSAGELHSTLCSCCAAGPGSGHWEWTRKYQWALLG